MDTGLCAANEVRSKNEGRDDTPAWTNPTCVSHVTVQALRFTIRGANVAKASVVCVAVGVIPREGPSTVGGASP